MTKPINLNVRVSGPLSEFIAANVGEDGLYENVSEYVRDLIRRDRERVEQEKFEALKAELQRAFATPDDQYVEVTADEVIARNLRRRRG
ncbi:addiction module antitoxin [Sphingomonas sp. dw_22]|uniref:ribbon-helix-helix domain-containing protein n=1 Tax=Sphingomonas sp. dw_22 TaxID=2721175 RepID=UPI001BD4BCB4|nr:addiction module antitoxin [Sphingomonas sp. dw_22]